MKLFVVIDMQNDFTTGALYNEDAIAVIPYIKEKLIKAKEENDMIIFTRDTHEENYMDTMEGKKLPVPHCIKNTKGHEVVDELKEFLDDATIFDKKTFGSIEFGMFLRDMKEKIDTIEFVGVCTDICVISNVMMAKAVMPNAEIIVDAKGCAGVTKDAHNTALDAMKACHIDIINE
ncbi:MAG: cysteine hydrolase [Lachnospiraceae bacterium]|nr:cysteine hydrolase [Lachnospiraceae bacterium]